MRDQLESQPHDQARAVGRWRSLWQALFALDVVYLVVAAVICLGAVVYAVVSLDADTLVLAVVGLATVFVIGCIVFGVQNLNRRR